MPFARKGIEIPFPQRVVHQTGESEVVADGQAVGRMVTQLAAVDFLGTLDTKQLEMLAKEARWEFYLPGERVVRQGEAGEVLYVIASGNADVRLEQGGLSSTVTTLDAGKCFGEMSVTDRRAAFGHGGGCNGAVGHRRREKGFAAGCSG
jgi:CRP-like cAMP-binding protein